MYILYIPIPVPKASKVLLEAPKLNMNSNRREMKPTNTVCICCAEGNMVKYI
jgi:ribosomal protein L32